MKEGTKANTILQKVEKSDGAKNDNYTCLLLFGSGLVGLTAALIREILDEKCHSLVANGRSGYGQVSATDCGDDGSGMRLVITAGK